ncbi:5-oxoprolinase/urea amidolyase family protein [Microbacterium sp. MC2]
MTPRILPFGDRALLLEVDALDAVLDLHGRLAASMPEGVVDLVPAARTVLVHVDPVALPLVAARAWVDAGVAAPRPPSGGAQAAVVDLPVVYDGADLAETAALVGVTPEELVERHAAAVWTVAFTGFAPGFGYLVSDDWPFDVPRRASPRTRVPAGAVGLAGEFSGAYPRDTPGGWQLIGTTAATLFDPAAAQPALLTPGARVRFRPTRPAAAGAAGGRPTGATPATPALVPTAGANPTTPAREQREGERTGDTHAFGAQLFSRGEGGPHSGAAALRVVEPGLRATVQDQGRPGHAAEGIALSGAADRAALRTAHRLVGNDEHAAGIEITMGGFRAVAQRDLWCAVTGAWGPIRLGGREVDPYEAHEWPAGAELHIDWFAHGARGYLAVRGGFDVPAAAGSRATDTMSGLGPAPLAAGDILRLGDAATGPIPVEVLHPWGPPADDLIELELAPGPRADWFTPVARDALFDIEWTVSHQADRVGIRLDGPALPRADARELPSEGMLPGAIQVPPSGQPVIFGPDAPVTGGYPVIAVASDPTRDALAQARPGTRIRFRHARPVI